MPIGGPDRPPITQSPSPGSIHIPSAASSLRQANYYDRSDRRSLDTDLHSPSIKGDPEQLLRHGSEYPSEPPSAGGLSSVPEYLDRSASAYPEVRGYLLKPQDVTDENGEPQKKRQKRNKPTLSCFECVERKTKVRAFHNFFPSPQLPLVKKALTTCVVTPFVACDTLPYFT